MMSVATPTCPLESSAKRLVKRVNACTELSFEQTPVRYITSKRKIAQILSSTLSSGITLLSIGDQTFIDEQIISDDSILSLNKTFTEDNDEKSQPWEIIDSIKNDSSKFSIITMNQSDKPKAVVTSKWSSKVPIHPVSLFERVLKLLAPKPLTKDVKFINRCVRDIDRLQGTFGQEWITLPNFV